VLGLVRIADEVSTELALATDQRERLHPHLHSSGAPFLEQMILAPAEPPPPLICRATSCERC